MTKLMIEKIQCHSYEIGKAISYDCELSSQEAELIAFAIENAVMSKVNEIKNARLIYRDFKALPSSPTSEIKKKYEQNKLDYEERK